MELLESVGPRPRQARYQAALRPDVLLDPDSRALPNVTATPIRRLATSVATTFGDWHRTNSHSTSPRENPEIGAAGNKCGSERRASHMCAAVGASGRFPFPCGKARSCGQYSGLAAR